MKNCARFGSTAFPAEPRYAGFVRAIVALTIGLSSGCVGSYGCLPPDTRIYCDATTPCPDGLTCLPALKRCARPEDIAENPIVSNAAVTPRFVTRGTLITARFDYNTELHPVGFDLEENPRLYLDLDDPIDLDLTAPTVVGDQFEYTFVAPGLLTPGSYEVKLDIVAIDGQLIADEPVGEFVLDVEPPALVGELEVTPRRGFDGDELIVSGEAREAVEIRGLRLAGQSTVLSLDVTFDEANPARFSAQRTIDDALPSGTLALELVLADEAGNVDAFRVPDVVIDRVGPEILERRTIISLPGLDTPPGTLTVARRSSIVTVCARTDEAVQEVTPADLDLQVSAPLSCLVKAEPRLPAAGCPEGQLTTTFQLQSRLLSTCVTCLAAATDCPMTCEPDDDDCVSCADGCLAPVQGTVSATLDLQDENDFVSLDNDLGTVMVNGVPQLDGLIVDQTAVRVLNIPVGFPEPLPFAEGGSSNDVTFPAGPAAGVVPAFVDDGRCVESTFYASPEELTLDAMTFLPRVTDVPAPGPEDALAAVAFYSTATDQGLLGVTTRRPDGRWSFPQLTAPRSDQVYAFGLDRAGNVSGCGTAIENYAWVLTPGADNDAVVIEAEGSMRFNGALFAADEDRDESIDPAPPLNGQSVTVRERRPWELVQFEGRHPPIAATTHLASDLSRGVVTLLTDQGVVWDFDGRDWQTRDVGGFFAPLPREAHTLTYAAHRGASLLFGGLTDAGYANDLWSLRGDTWALLHSGFPAPGTPDEPIPASRAYHATVYDAASQRLFVFGGAGYTASGATKVFNDTWSYAEDVGWTLEHDGSGTAPSPRYFASMAAQVASVPSRLVLVGGFVEDQPQTSVPVDSEIWEFDTESAQWTSYPQPNVTPSGFAHAVFMPRARAINIFTIDNPDIPITGCAASSGQIFVGKRWTNNDDTTEQLNALTPAPGEPVCARHGAGLGRLPNGDIVLTGGTGYSGPGAGAPLRRTDRTRAVGNRVIDERISDIPPSARTLVAGASDVAGNVIFVGGATSSAPMAPVQPAPDPLWLFNGSGFRNLAPTGSGLTPRPRYDAAVTYRGGEHDEFIIVGGRGQDTAPLADANDVVRRVEVSSGTLVDAPLVDTGIVRPGPRAGVALAYHPEEDLVVAFGGVVGGNVSDETWILDGGDTWTLAPSGGPDARTAAQLTYSPDAGLILFGGRTAAQLSGAVQFRNDVWRFNVGSSTWELVDEGCTVTPSTEPGRVACACIGDDAGPLCVPQRPRPRSNASMFADVRRNEIVVSGGYASGVFAPQADALTYTSNTVWSLDGDGWSPIFDGVNATSTIPLPHAEAATAFVPDTGEAFIFGGRTALSGVVQRLWRRLSTDDVLTGDGEVPAPAPVMTVRFNLGDAVTATTQVDEAFFSLDCEAGAAVFDADTAFDDARAGVGFLLWASGRPDDNSTLQGCYGTACADVGLAPMGESGEAYPNGSLGDGAWMTLADVSLAQQQTPSPFGLLTCMGPADFDRFYVASQGLLGMRCTSQAPLDKEAPRAVRLNDAFGLVKYHVKRDDLPDDAQLEFCLAPGP